MSCVNFKVIHVILIVSVQQEDVLIVQHGICTKGMNESDAHILTLKLSLL